MITIESYKNIIIVSINKDKIDNFWELLENAKNKSFSSNNGKILQFIYNDISKVIIRDNNIIIFINSINFNTIRNIFKDYLNSKRIFPLDISLEQLGFIIEPEEVKDIVFECGEFDEELFSEACVQQLPYKENFRCPFKYQGQYYDPEIELCYNRFRYYQPETGRYISEDPIKLLGGFNVFAYVSDTNAWVDLLGLNENSYSKDKRYTPDQQALVDLINEQLMINQPMTKKNKKRLTNEQADMALELAQEVNTNVPMPYKVLDHRFSNSNNEGHYKDEGSNGHIHIGRAGKGHISVNNRLDDD